MAIIERKQLKGLYLKGSPIAIDPAYASDCRNVIIDTNNQVRKRTGFDTVLTDANILDTIEYEGFGPTKELYVKADGLYEESGGSLVAVRNAYTENSLSPNYSGLTDFDEYNNVVYITDTEQKSFVNKYDGAKFFRAGVKKPTSVSYAQTNSGTIDPTQTHLRVFVSQLDFQLNEVFSDYVDFSLGNVNINSSYTVTIPNNQFKTYPNNTSSFVSDGTSAIGGGLTWYFGYSAKNNLEVGDYVYIRFFGSSGPYANIIIEVPCKVLEVNTGSMDIKVEGPDPITGLTPYVNSGEFYSNMKAYFFVSRTSADYGYKEYQLSSQTQFLDFTSANTVFSLIQLPSVTTLSSSRELSEVYDISSLKGEIPLAKYISFFQGQMILSSSKDVVSANQVTGLSQNSVHWSDPTTGGSVESFSPSANSPVGKTDEGQISGMYSFSDYMVIFKKYATYMMYGDLLNLNIRFQKASAFNVGCISHKSIIEVVNQCYFMTQRGIYTVSANGDVNEFSDAVDPVFEDDYPIPLDLTRSRSILDFKQELLSFFIPSTTPSQSITISVNYKTGDWVILDGFDASKGFFGSSEKVVAVSDSGKVVQSNGQLNDDGNAINAYYATGWENLGKPSLLKKFLNIFIYTINSLAYNITTKLQIEWEESDVSVRSSNKASSDKTIKTEFQSNQSRSARVIMSNNNVDEDLVISAYDITVEPTQSRIKE